MSGSSTPFKLKSDAELLRDIQEREAAERIERDKQAEKDRQKRIRDFERQSNSGRSFGGKEEYRAAKEKAYAYDNNSGCCIM